MPNIDERTRRRRALYRAWRRGTKELDLLLGRFASEWLASARPEKELSLFEAFLDENDTDLYSWIMSTQRGDTPHNEIYAELIAKIRAFHDK